MQATKQARALVTRERILQEATRLFALKGYHDTKLAEVLEAEPTSARYPKRWQRRNPRRRFERIANRPREPTPR